MDQEWPDRLPNETDEAYGFKVGYDDIYVEWWVLDKKSPEFRKGYKRGKNLCDDMIDDAAQYNAGFGSGGEF